MIKMGVKTMQYTDNPLADFSRYDDEREESLAKLPVCDECGEPKRS